MRDFTLESAREMGFSYGDIADYLAETKQFDVGQARQKGYSNRDIAAYLAGRDAAPKDDRITPADVRAESRRFGIDPAFAESLITQESGGNDRVRPSPKGARGIAQVIPETFRAVMGPSADIDDPWQNLEAGLKYIRQGAEKLGIDPGKLDANTARLLAGGYHQGYDRPELKRGVIAPTNDGLIDTPRYADAVMGRWQRLRSSMPDESVSPVSSRAPQETVTPQASRRYVSYNDYLKQVRGTPEGKARREDDIATEWVDRYGDLTPTKPASLGDRVSQGFRDTVAAGRIAMSNDPDNIAKIISENEKKRIDASPAAQDMQLEIAPYQKAAAEATGDAAVGAWAALIGKRLQQFVTNPKEFAGMVVESLPNTAPGLAGALAGGFGGAAAGTAAAGPPGAAVGAVGGMIGGGFLGGYGVEQGSAMRELVLRGAREAGVDVGDPQSLSRYIAQNYEDLLEKSRLKGVGTAGTDAVLNVVTLRLAGLGSRVLAKDAAALTAGVKAGTINAERGAAELARLEGMAAARSTLGARLRRGGAVTAAEMGGESLSEAAGQKLAFGTVDPLEVIDEGLLGFGQGAAIAAGRGAVNRVTGGASASEIDQRITEAKQAVATAPKATVADVLKAPTVDAAAVAAEAAIAAPLDQRAARPDIAGMQNDAVSQANQAIAEGLIGVPFARQRGEQVERLALPAPGAMTAAPGGLIMSQDQAAVAQNEALAARLRSQDTLGLTPDVRQAQEARARSVVPDAVAGFRTQEQALADQSVRATRATQDAAKEADYDRIIQESRFPAEVRDANLAALREAQAAPQTSLTPVQQRAIAASPAREPTALELAARRAGLVDETGKPVTQASVSQAQNISGNRGTSSMLTSENDQQILQVRRIAESRAAELSSVPRESGARVSGKNSVDGSSTQKGQLPELRQRVSASGEVGAGGVPALRKRGFADAPSGLQQTVAGGLDVPRVPPSGARTRGAAASAVPSDQKTKTKVDDTQSVRVGAVPGVEAAEDWQAFSRDSGTLGIPRADMPQVKSVHRGALVNFLNARGVTHTEREVPAASLKATQAEFSPAKVAQARSYSGQDRAVLVSTDGHIVDGHHQALAKAAAGENIRTIRLNAPVRDLLPLVREFPSSTTDEGATAPAALPFEDEIQDVPRGKSTIPPTTRVREAMANPDVRRGLDAMKSGIGAQEQGGRLLIDETTRDRTPGTGDVLGRTPWVGEKWWFGRPAPQIDANGAKAAIDKALAGKTLGAAEERFIVHALDVMQEGMTSEPLATAEDLNADEKPAERMSDDARELLNEFVAQNEAAIGSQRTAVLKEQAATETQDGTEQDYARALVRLIKAEPRPAAPTPEAGGAVESLTTALRALVTEIRAEAKPATPTAESAPPTARFSVRQDQTETPEFKRWFGDSKVVDAEGKPLVVYRGDKYLVNDFDPSKRREPGIFLTPDKDIAGIYAQGEPQPVFVKAERILDLTSDTRAARAWVAQWAANFDEWLDRGSGEPVDAFDVLQSGRLFDYEGDWSTRRWRDIQESARADGYDAVRLPDFDGQKGVFEALVVFDSRQIKSAIGNTGAFDPNNPDIRFSEATEAPAAEQRPHVSPRDAQAVVARIAPLNPGLPPVSLWASPAELPERAAGLRAEIERAGIGERVEGAYYNGEIFGFTDNIADEARLEHVLFTHEVTHAGLDQTLGPDLDRVMGAIYARNPNVRERAKVARERRGLDSNVAAVQEILADIPDAELVKLKGIDRLVSLARDWLANHGYTKLAARLDAWLEGRVGEQVLADAFVGDIVRAAREFARNGGGEGTRFYGSDVRFAADERVAQTETPEFKRWFGDSKVVDAEGKPLVVYHGGLRFDAFRSNPAAGAHYASESQDVASSYAEQYSADEAEIKPMYLRVVNPLDLTDAAAFERWVGVTPEASPFTGETSRSMALNAFDIRSGGKVIVRAKAAGYDGVIFYDTDARNRGSTRSFAFFNATQAKAAPSGEKSWWGYPIRAEGNTGAFDPNNPDIRFSLNNLQAAPSTAGFLNGVLKSPGSLGPLNAINTQYHKAEMLAKPTKENPKGKPEFKRVFTRTQQYLNDISAFAVDAEQEAPGIFRELRGLTKAAFREYHRWAGSDKEIEGMQPALHAGTLFGGGNPMEGRIWTKEELRYGGAILPVGAGRAAGLPAAVRARMERLPSGEMRIPNMFPPQNDKQIELYRQAHATIAQSLRDQAKSLIYRNVKNSGVTFDRAMALEDVVATVQEGLDTQIENLTLREQLLAGRGDTKGATAAASEAADLATTKLTVSAIADKAEGLIDHGYVPVMRFGNRVVVAKDTNGETQFVGFYDGKPLVPKSADAEMNKAAAELRAMEPTWTVTTDIKDEESWKLYDGLNLDALENFLDFIDPETKAALERDKTIQEYLSNAVNSRSTLTRMIHRKGTPGFSTDVPRTLASFITSNARSASGNYHSAEMKSLVEDIPQGDVRAEAAKLVKYVLEPQEEAAKLRSFLFFHFLGGSIAAGLVNLSQTPMMTAPALMARAAESDVSAKRVASSLVAAAKNAVLDPANISGEMGDQLQQAEREGITSPQMVHHLTATAANNPFSSNRHFRNFMTVWGAMFSATEVFNRRTAFMAAYDIAKNDMGKSKDEAYEFARDLVNETQLIYNKGNRMNLARGAIGATVLTFKTFAIGYLELLRRMPPKQQLMMLGMLVLMAGAEGLPFAEDIEDLIDTLGQSLGYTTNTGKWLRKTIRENLGEEFERPLLKGVGGMLALDLHSRLGFGNIIPATSFFKQSEIEKSRDALEAIGPIGGVLKNLSDSLQMLARGRLGDASLNVMPKAVRDAVNGFHMATTGTGKDAKGNLTLPDVTLGESAGKFIGFNLQRAARAGEIKRDAMQDKNLRQVRMDEIAGDWADGILKGDQDAVAEARDTLIDWNRNNPELRIPLPGIMRSVQERVKAARMTGDKRFLKSLPAPMRQGVAEDMR